MSRTRKFDHETMCASMCVRTARSCNKVIERCDRSAEHQGRGVAVLGSGGNQQGGH